MVNTIRFIFLMLVSLVITMPAWSCSDDDDKDEIVSYDRLPGDAKNFILTYYPGAQIAGVIMDKNHGRTTYEVSLYNGHELEFDAEGQWTDVDAPYGQTVPAGIVPPAIAAYVADNYSVTGINEISRDNRGYEVELNTGVELIFDRDGKFVRIDR